jgi:hypothetical protein
MPLTSYRFLVVMPTCTLYKKTAFESILKSAYHLASRPTRRRVIAGHHFHHTDLSFGGILAYLLYFIIYQTSGGTYHA